MTNPAPLFRAFVTFKLLAVAQLRPAEWGLHMVSRRRHPPPGAHPIWAPRISKAAIGWCRSGAKNLKGRLQEYFAQARAIPLEKQARFLQQLARETCEKGFVLRRIY